MKNGGFGSGKPMYKILYLSLYRFFLRVIPTS